MSIISARSLMPLAFAFLAAFLAAFVVADLTGAANPDNALWFVTSLAAAMIASGLAVMLGRRLSQPRGPHHASRG